MPRIPDTRISLILRLATPNDVEAWQAFAETYAPAAYGMARKRGFQHADAEDLVQELLVAVAQAASRWRPNPEQARFRTWLFRVARNLLSDRIRDRMRDHTRNEDNTTLENGDSFVEGVVDSTGLMELNDQFELEFRRVIFQCAAKSVRQRVEETTWQAFQLSAIDRVPIASISTQLGKSPGCIYVARSRVMKLLREESERLLQQIESPQEAMDSETSP